MPEENTLYDNNGLKSLRTNWDNDFPEVLKFSTVTDRRENKNYYAAKKQANMDAAMALVEDLMPAEKLKELKEKFDDKNPVLMPVHALEIVKKDKEGNPLTRPGLSQNVIPIAMAIHIHKYTGWDIETNIVQSNVAGRTGANGLDRFAFPARFDGEVKENKNYIILDDHVSMAGTVASAKGHIEHNGGKVVAISSLTANHNSLHVSLTQKNLRNMRQGGNFYNTIARYEDEWKETFGYGYDSLTNAEAKWIMENIRLENTKNSICKKDNDSLYTVSDFIKYVKQEHNELSLVDNNKKETIYDNTKTAQLYNMSPK